MLSLPAATEIRKVITKKKVYERFGTEMSAERRKSFDADVPASPWSTRYRPFP